MGCETLERLWFVAGNFSRRDKGGSAGYYRFIEHNINHTIITIIIIKLIKTSITFCSYHSTLLDSPLLCVPELGLSTEKHSMTIMTTVVNFNHHRDDDDEANLNLSMKIPEQPSQVCCSPRSQPSVSISLQPSEPKKCSKLPKWSELDLILDDLSHSSTAAAILTNCWLLTQIHHLIIISDKYDYQNGCSFCFVAQQIFHII